MQPNKERIQLWVEALESGERAAGPFRNSSMAKAGADMCLAFLREESRGTRDMIEKARAEKIPTFVIPWEEVDES